jgi:hypothetical protein
MFGVNVTKEKPRKIAQDFVIRRAVNCEHPAAVRLHGRSTEQRR